jgi:hypothetical protein
MVRRSISGLTLFLAAIAAHAGVVTQAATGGRVGVLEVRNGHGGVPCFSIQRQEEERGGAPNFHAITVNTVDQPRVSAWSMTLPPHRTFAVSSLMCIPYAGRLPVLPQTPAAALLPGKVYEVAIEARGPLAAGAVRSYRARFCVDRQTPLVRQPETDARGRLSCPS